MSIANPTRSCYEVIRELDEAVKGVLWPDQEYFVLGGIATAAINDAESIFDHQTDSLIASPSSALPVARANGTRRDIDVLVLDKLSKEQAGRIKSTISEAVGNTLVVSIFGVEEHHEPTPLRRIGRLATSWTSKRTVDETGQHYYELAPLIQAVPVESYRPWRLELPDDDYREVSILNPAAHMLAYYIRSISGERPKDKQKVDAMRHKIESDPVFNKQIYSGQLRSWLDFATGIQGIVDGTYFPPDVLQMNATGIEQRAFRLRGNLLRRLESNETLVKRAQTGLFQKLLQPFIGAS